MIGGITIILEGITEKTLARMAVLCEQQDILDKVKQKELLGTASLERVSQAKYELERNIRLKMGEGNVVRYYKLVTRCQMEPAAVCALETCLTVQRYPELLGVIKALGYTEVTLEFAIRLEAAGRGEEP